jgi:hypothetical protein
MSTINSTLKKKFPDRCVLFLLILCEHIGEIVCTLTFLVIQRCSIYYLVLLYRRPLELLLFENLATMWDLSLFVLFLAHHWHCI